jgi:LmbE family N-acetylglucosaminyl deacetylase
MILTELFMSSSRRLLVAFGLMPDGRGEHGGSAGSAETVLVVGAHPDDIDFGASGTVATWTDAGVRVVYCIVTDGDAGGFDPAVSRSAMVGIRRAEQEAAAKVVGVDQVEFLGYPDGRLVASLDLRRDLARMIRRVGPDRVVGPSPERNWRRIQASHPDHLATGEATLAAVYPDARNPFAFPELLEEGLEPHVASEVWLMASPRADHLVDVTDSIDRKVAALRSHISQLPDPDALEERVRMWTATLAEEGGMPPGRMAEAFQIVETG